ncbi:hypothetical protein D3C76_1679280 [compost metagenome]
MLQIARMILGGNHAHHHEQLLPGVGRSLQCPGQTLSPFRVMGAVQENPGILGYQLQSARPACLGKACVQRLPVHHQGLILPQHLNNHQRH